MSSELDAALKESVRVGIAPGISAAIARSGEVVWSGTAGVSSVDNGSPVLANTLFGIGSVTKTFVAALVLQLALEGRLDLRNPASKFLGSIAEAVPNASKATIGELLNHTSGIPSWEDVPRWIRMARGAGANPHRIWGKGDCLPFIADSAPVAPTGERYGYSNTNYTLLGLIVERITAVDLVTHLHERLRKPLGLKDVFLAGFELLPVDRMSGRYHRATPAYFDVAGMNERFRQVRPGLIDVSESNLSAEWAAGGIVAIASDVALFGAALAEGRILGTEGMSWMTDWLSTGSDFEAGRGLFRKAYDGTCLIGHSGDVLGSSATMYWIEGSDMAVAVLCNAGSMHSGSECPAVEIGRQANFVNLVQKRMQ